MSSETIESSSFFSNELAFRDERPPGFWKTDGMDKFYGMDKSPLQEQAQGNGFEHSNSYVNLDHRANSHLDIFAPSVGAENHHEENEPVESLKEIEAKTIGDLLPDDDDDLFYSVVDKIDSKNHLISSNWGLGLDGHVKPEALEPNSTYGDRPLGEYPSRTLFVQNIDSSIHDAELRTLFRRYGDISALYTKCKSQGFIMVSYYDIRAACNAIKALQNIPMQHSKLDLHFSFPKENPCEKDVDQNSLVVFDIDSSVSNDELRQIFAVCGEVKEIHESPHRSNQKVIEFYDVRAADAALCALNRSDIAGNNIELEPSYPASARSISRGGITPNSGYGTALSARSSGRPPMSPCWENAFSGPNNRSQSLQNLESPNNQLNSMEINNSNGQSNYNIWGTTDFLPDSFANGALCKSPGGRFARPAELQENSFGRISPRGHLNEWNENVFNASPHGNCISPGQQYIWSGTSNLPSPQSQGIMWPNSPSFLSGTSSPLPQQMNNHPVASPISPNPSLWERRHGYAAEPPETPVFNSGSLGGLNIPGNSPHVMEFSPHNLFSLNGGSPMEIVHSPNVNQTYLVVPARGPFSPLMSPFTSPNERTKGRKSDSNQGDNKHFELDIERIMQGEDKRTTLMIKNIPNKYTSKMLLAAIDERHKGTYDFLYLPIDFKNKCNVGYAFINMTDPSLIVPLHQALNGRKWEKFNSEKVATLAYARIQGKAALISHFQNSSLMNEDKRCRPMLFLTDGPNAGEQVPFPTGSNIRSRGSRINSPCTEKNSQETLQDSADDKENSCGNACPETSVC